MSSYEGFDKRDWHTTHKIKNQLVKLIHGSGTSFSWL